MFGNVTKKKQFSYTSIKSLRTEKNKSLREKMTFSSFSSQERRPSKRKMIYLTILLILVLGYITFQGFNSITVKEIIIKENEIEKMNE